MSGRVLRYGPHAWLVEHNDPATLASAIRRAGLAGVGEVVPGAATALVILVPGHEPGAVESALEDLAASTAADPAEADVGPVVEIPVTYDGEDLSAVAAASGLTVDEVIARHQDAFYSCAFCGFAPGFGYLAGLDPALHLPRRASPRPRIPAGAVAIASRYTAVYPSASPGGWHLIGHTDTVLWRADRDPPSLITPGALVRFVGTAR